MDGGMRMLCIQKAFQAPCIAYVAQCKYMRQIHTRDWRYACGSAGSDNQCIVGVSNNSAGF